MGKYLDKFKQGAEYVDDRANKIAQNRSDNFDNGKVRNKRTEKMGEGLYDGIDDDDFDDDYSDDDRYDIGIQTAQKPESFHHFILENQYKDIEKDIRGYKDVLNKTTQKWEVKRKDAHCFTDEEAEDIVRTAQSHLATDIKLSCIHKDSFGEMMMAIYKRLDELFYSIAEYRYGRYNFNKDGTIKKDAHAVQYEMKLQNRKIFLELWTRIQANYSRAIGGQENKATHGSVKGQESLNNSDRIGGNGGQY